MERIVGNVCRKCMEPAKFILTVVALVYSSKLCADLMLYLELNKRVYNHMPGQCSIVSGIEHGAFDIAYIPSKDVLIVTSGLRDYANVTFSRSDKKIVSKTLDPYKRGTAYSYNVSGQTNWELPINSNTLSPEQFNPAGISIYDNIDKIHVYVVNQRRWEYSTVEKFIYNDKSNDKSLVHKKTIKNRNFGVLRDISLVDDNRFYASKYYLYNNYYLRNAEHLMGLKTGSLLFYDGKITRQVRTNIASPAGVQFDRIRRFLYVSSIGAQAIYVFKVKEDYNVTLVKRIDLYMSPDQITLDELMGDIYVAGHPIKSRFFFYERNTHTSHAPSQVLKLTMASRNGKKWRISQVFHVKNTSRSYFTDDDCFVEYYLCDK